MFENEATSALLSGQETRAEQIKEINTVFPKLTPRGERVTTMYSKFAELDQLWVDFLNVHQILLLRDDLDGGHAYFTTKFEESVRSYVVAITETMNAHVTNLRGINPAYDLIKRPSKYAFSTMINTDGSIKQDLENPFVDPSIITSKSQDKETPPLLDTQREPRITAGPRSRFSTSVHDLFNLSGPNSRQSGQANLVLIMGTIEQLVDEIEKIPDGDARLFIQGNILVNRMKGGAIIHEKLLVTDGYDPTGFFALEEKVAPILERLSSLEEAQNIPKPPANGQQQIKMPTINMPTFDGDYTKWRWFKDLFLEMVNRRSISSVEKFVYLRQNLTGECAKLINHLPLTNDNYQLAWTTLEKRYENPRQIMKATINKLFNLERARSECPSTMKKIHDIFHENMHSILQTGGTPNEVLGMIFHQLLLNKLDQNTYTLYEQSLADATVPQSADNLLVFLVKRFQALEQSGATKSNPPPQPKPQFPKWKRTTALVASAPPVVATKATTGKLCECKERHPVVKCQKFIALSPQERYKKVRDARRCVICFAGNHTAKECKSKKCNECAKPHHTLLHFDSSKATSLLSAAPDHHIQHVFLGTVRLRIQNANGAFVDARALLDSGSQVSIMTEKLLRKTSLKTQDSSMEILGMGQVSSKVTKRTVVNIASSHSNYKTSLEVYVMKNITSVQPSSHMKINDWNIPPELQLADKEFNVPAAVDLIIGGELFYQLLATGFQQLGNKLPDLQNTVFGWMVVGKMVGLEPTTAFTGIALSQEASLKESLTKFWEIEERGTTEVQLGDKDLACERYFEDTTVQGSDNRFIVKLQFESNPDEEIGRSLETATRRFYALERKLSRDPEMKRQYDQFMDEYEELGHMEELAKQPEGLGCYYIPHHAVLNPGSSTTKFRVVFDASAKTSTNTSLNELMANGPMLQDDLFTIMARFRMMEYVFSADITKMYRQIKVAEEDQRWQLILWRKAPSQRLKTYRLKTVTYGTKCASYLAIKTLQHLADIKAEKYPLAHLIAKRDFNVDDIMTGSNDLNEAISMQAQLISMLKEAGMELHKWCANHSKLLKRIPNEKKEISLEIYSDKQDTKALGLRWTPRTDRFSLKYEPKPHEKITKRNVLSEIASLFDPLGLVNPVIVRAKVFIQELWDLKYGWDAEIPAAMQEQWIKYRTELHALADICVSRHVVIKNAAHRELHIFSDASEVAYGATVYVRSTNRIGETALHLLCSKSRVAPVEKMSLPRLELCGAKVAVELGQKLVNKLGSTIDRIVYWTDSEIVLSWISSPATLKTFVANRISKIRRSSAVTDWRYIETKHNPADIVSRGCSAKELKNNSLWWNGPSFLSRSEATWPTTKPAFKRELEEEKQQKSILVSTFPELNIMGQIKHRNSIITWQRIVAYCLKFGTRLQHNHHDKTTINHLTKEELNRAMQALIRYAQRSAFAEDIEFIKKGRPEKTQFKTMTPIFDADGVLRVGGRLQATDMPFEEKHPAILPYNHEVAKLILKKIHLDNMHAGPQALLAIARQKYWIIKGKVMAKNIVDTCVLCCRAKPKLLEQVMGPLPKDRVTAARPFQTSGIDFAGPVYIHQTGRGQKILKAYICVFVCFSTKAVHLEAAIDMSTPSFLRCLKRFIARRGVPCRIYSDNGTNFRGMNNQLLDLADQMNSDEFKSQVSRHCENHNIEWRFTPPRSPHFGGLWEAAVKSAKHLLIRTLHNHHVNYDELITVLAEIEAILNSRPISPLSSDPNDLQPLTAGHFLIGAPLNSINDEFIPDTTQLQQWAKLVAIRNEFWKRWHKEYLHELQTKNKWRVGSPNVKIGTLVTLRDQNITPLQWRMGRIESLVPDKDGIIRVVRVKTSSGLFMRAIHELAPLPIEPVVQNSTPDLVMKSKLNVEAREFQMKKKPGEFHKPTNKTVKTPVKRKQKQVKFNGLDNLPSTTRSGKIFGKTSWPKTSLMFLIALALIIMGATGNPCNTTQFTTNPGLYYESLGKLSLSNDEWKLVCHMDMAQYRRETSTITTLLNFMKETCPSIHPDDHCHIVLSQLTDQVAGINSRNELIQGFAEKTRQKRDLTDFFTGRKNGGHSPQNGNENEKRFKHGWFKQIGKLSQDVFGMLPANNTEEGEAALEETLRKIRIQGIMSELLGEIETAEQKEMGERINKAASLKRVKRGWFDGFGKGAKEVFGILNVDDAERYDQQITDLKKDDSYLKELIANQTTIQEITSQIIRRNEEKLNSVMNLLASGVQGFAEKDSVGKTNIFNTLSLQTLHSIQRYQEIQMTIINMLTSVFHGKIPPTLISPTQLRQNLALVASHIDHSLMIPGSDDRNYISQLYKMLSAKVHVTEHRIIIEVKIPLISREHYQLYHIVPVPFQQNEKLRMIAPSVTYIGINPKQDHYYLMTMEEKHNCLIYNNGLLICKQQQPLHNVQANQTRCEMAVLMEPKQVHRSCKIIDFNFAQSWIALAQTNHHMYAMREKVDVNIICGTSTTHCTLDGTGIIELDQNCMIKSGTLEISSKNQLDGDKEIILVIPNSNVTEHMHETHAARPPSAVANWNDFRDNNAEWEVLKNAIEQQKTNANRVLPNHHDIHHYSVTYSMMGIMIIIGLLYWQRKRLGAMCKKPPTPVNRKFIFTTANDSAIMQEATELQTIKITEPPTAVQGATGRFMIPAVPPRNQSTN